MPLRCPSGALKSPLQHPYDKVVHIYSVKFGSKFILSCNLFMSRPAEEEESRPPEEGESRPPEEKIADFQKKIKMPIPPRNMRLAHLRQQHMRLQRRQDMILAALLLEEQRLATRRTVWVKPWLMHRGWLGQYDTLMQELMQESQGDFKSFLRRYVSGASCPSHPTYHKESRQQTSTGTWSEVGDHPPIPGHWELLPQSGV
jgi:hypothetical protein